MRFLFITKRQYTNKDLIDDRYGRCRELPLQLSFLKHQVIGTCLSYAKKPESIVLDSVDTANVEWHSLNAGIFKLPGLIRYFFYTYRLAKRFQPDVIIASSDSIYGIVALFISRLLKRPYVFDLYDNYESFAAINFPLVRFLYARAIFEACLVTVVSEPLKQYVTDKFSRKGPIEIVENGVNPNLFHARAKDKCRRSLNLPENAILIGVAGAISRSRGIEIIFPAFAKLLQTSLDVYLVLAGKIDADLEIPTSDRIIKLGELSFEKMPLLVASLDVSNVSNIDSAFGRYCYPQKFAEAVATHTPPVVAAVGAMQTLLKGTPELLFKPGDADDLFRAINYQLDQGVVPQLTLGTWMDLGKQLDQSIKKALGKSR
jgi:teichuronic acid biosynthesis glycosyltransferase TuaC